MEKEDLIKWKKKQITDWLNLCETMGISQTEREKRLDMFLDDLYKILKQKG